MKLSGEAGEKKISYSSQLNYQYNDKVVSLLVIIIVIFQCEENLVWRTLWMPHIEYRDCPGMRVEHRKGLKRKLGFSSPS